MKLEELLKAKQPEVYSKLAAARYDKPKPKKVKITDVEARKLMSHDAFVRENGAVRQIRH